MVWAEFQQGSLIRDFKLFVFKVGDKEIDLLLFIRCAKIHIFMQS